MPTFPPTNLRMLRPSRKKQRTGDVFAMMMPDDCYLFGRVIEANIMEPGRAPMPGSHLIYVYDVRSDMIEPEIDLLSPDRLLIAPLFTNSMPWTRGYFETVANVEIGANDEIEQYCFWRATSQRYVDRNLVTLRARSEPCGDWGLVSYRWIDDRVSEALGIALVEDDT